MQIQKISALRGPNYWSVKHHHLIALTLDLQEYQNIQTHLVSGFPERLEALLPSLNRYPSHNDKYEHFLQEVHEGTSWSCVVLRTAQELLSLAGMPCTHAELHKAGNSGVYQLLFSYADEEAGKYAASEAVRLTEALIQGNSYDLAETISALNLIRKRNALGPSTKSIYDEAVRRGIPALSLDEGSLIQLGYGAAQKRFEATIASTTSNIAVDIAGNKHATKHLLTSVSLPVPKGEVIRNVENLEVVIADLHFPIVIKPLDGNQGKGATININSIEGAIEAFHRARRYSDRVVIERYIEGYDFRVLVINRKFVAAARRTPAAVTGTGFQTIRQLVEQVNSEPRRGDGHDNMLTKIIIDTATIDLLAAKGYTLDTIPKRGEEVWLKATANLSTGGTAEDVTDAVHPSNIALAERVARTIGLDICGIDIMAPDLSTPLAENGGVIIEVNAAPGFRMHLEPTAGTPRNVAAPVLDMLFPDGDQGRIPIVAVSGTNGKTTTTRLIAQMAQQGGYCTGFTTTDGIYIDRELVSKGDCSGPASAKIVLKDPAVEFAVLECARGGILRSGLGFDQSDCAVVTNVAEDHLGLNGIHTIEQLAKVKAVVAKTVKKEGYAILNADDDLVYAMKDEVDCRVALFSLYANNIRVERHCEAGGLAAIYEDGYIIIRKGSRLIPIELVENIPLTHNGKARFNIANVMGAVLAAYVSAIPLPAIRCTLRRFRNSTEDTPGRMNTFEFGSFSMLVDYAHNTHGLKALGEYIGTVPASKKIGIITGVGDRRNEDIMNLGKEAARIFDEIVIRYDEDLRGRTEFEIGSLLRSGIQQVTSDMNVVYCSGECDAINVAMEMSTPGTLIVLLAENIGTVCQKLKELQMSYQDEGKEVRIAV
jgi:cyanophycin synthetase